MESKIKDSWNRNAQEWIRVIESGQIESRRFTDKAILEVLRETPAQRILDIGCGEGWLVRAMTEMGKSAIGIDTTEALLENARSKGPEAYYLLGYEDIMDGQDVPGAPFDIVVFNFSIYQKEGLEVLLQSVKRQLAKNGRVIVQTIHPSFLTNNGLEYQSQTITDSWKGLPGNFLEGHPWYARTFEGWLSVISKSGMTIVAVRETINDKKEPISLILMAE